MPLGGPSSRRFYIRCTLVSLTGAVLRLVGAFTILFAEQSSGSGDSSEWKLSTGSLWPLPEEPTLRYGRICSRRRSARLSKTRIALE
jgi:hypothetical protein